VERKYLKDWGHLFSNPEKKHSSSGSEMDNLLTLRRDSKSCSRLVLPNSKSRVMMKEALHMRVMYITVYK
jgi:hypothetical protein